jgi:hypothetical protein
LGDRLTETGAFVFQGGLTSAESATVVRQSGGDFLTARWWPPSYRYSTPPTQSPAATRRSARG